MTSHSCQVLFDSLTSRHIATILRIFPTLQVLEVPKRIPEPWSQWGRSGSLERTALSRSPGTLCLLSHRTASRTIRWFPFSVSFEPLPLTSDMIWAKEARAGAVSRLNGLCDWLCPGNTELKKVKDLFSVSFSSEFWGPGVNDGFPKGDRWGVAYSCALCGGARPPVSMVEHGLELGEDGWQCLCFSVGIVDCLPLLLIRDNHGTFSVFKIFISGLLNGLAGFF